MIDKLKQVYFKEMFMPSFFSVFINPFYIIRKGLYKAIVSKKQYLKGRMLDFGCGSKPYKEIFDVEEYIGLDIEQNGHSHKSEQIDVYYDGKTIPLGDNYFDSIFSSEVFEHIFNLDHILNELNRVLKPGGYMLVTLPFVWDEHEIPYDFARYSSFGIEYLLKRAGFEIVVCEKTSNYVETVFQMWNAYVSQYLLPSNGYLKILMIPFFIAPITIFGILVSKLFPENYSFYHNNVVVVKKPENSA